MLDTPWIKAVNERLQALEGKGADELQKLVKYTMSVVTPLIERIELLEKDTHPPTKLPVDDVVRRLEAVEKRLGPATPEPTSDWGNGHEVGYKFAVDRWKRCKENSRSCGTCGGVNWFRAGQEFDKLLGLKAEDVVDGGGE